MVFKWSCLWALNGTTASLCAVHQYLGTLFDFWDRSPWHIKSFHSLCDQRTCSLGTDSLELSCLMLLWNLRCQHADCQTSFISTTYCWLAFNLIWLTFIAVSVIVIWLLQSPFHVFNSCYFDGSLFFWNYKYFSISDILLWRRQCKIHYSECRTKCNETTRLKE